MPSACAARSRPPDCDPEQRRHQEDSDQTSADTGLLVGDGTASLQSARSNPSDASAATWLSGKSNFAHYRKGCETCGNDEAITDGAKCGDSSIGVEGGKSQTALHDCHDSIVEHTWNTRANTSHDIDKAEPLPESTKRSKVRGLVICSLEMPTNSAAHRSGDPASHAISFSSDFASEARIPGPGEHSSDPDGCAESTTCRATHKPSKPVKGVETTSKMLPGQHGSSECEASCNEEVTRAVRTVVDALAEQVCHAAESVLDERGFSGSRCTCPNAAPTSEIPMRLAELEQALPHDDVNFGEVSHCPAGTFIAHDHCSHKTVAGGDQKVTKEGHSVAIEQGNKPEAHNLSSDFARRVRNRRDHAMNERAQIGKEGHDQEHEREKDQAQDLEREQTQVRAQQGGIDQVQSRQCRELSRKVAIGQERVLAELEQGRHGAINDSGDIAQNDDLGDADDDSADQADDDDEDDNETDDDEENVAVVMRGELATSPPRKGGEQQHQQGEQEEMLEIQEAHTRGDDEKRVSAGEPMDAPTTSHLEEGSTNITGRRADIRRRRGQALFERFSFWNSHARSPQRTVQKKSLSKAQLAERSAGRAWHKGQEPHDSPLYQYIPRELCDSILHIKSHGLSTVGIFRVPGDATRVAAIRAAFSRGEEDCFLSPECTVHDAATVLKQSIRELPEPLVPFQVYKKLLRAARKYEVSSRHGRKLSNGLARLKRTGSNLGLTAAAPDHGPDSKGPSDFEGQLARQAKAVCDVALSLPPAQRQCLSLVLRLLYIVSELSSENRMTTQALAIVFAPTLMNVPDSVPPKTVLRDMPIAIAATKALIENASALPEVELSLVIARKGPRADVHRVGALKTSECA